MKSPTPIALSLVLLLAACGSDGDAESTSADDTTTTTAAAETSEATIAETTEAADAVDDDEAEAAETDDEVAEPATDASWDGPAAGPLLDEAMGALEAPIGGPLTPEAVAGLFAWPADFPSAEGTIVGTQRNWELRNDEVEETRRVGVDVAATAESLDAHQATVEAGGVWTRSSSQRDSFLTDLYTNDAGDRMVLGSKTELDPGAAGLTYELEPGTPDDLAPPAWVAGLPVAPGGQLIEWVEGVGPVQDSFSAGDPAGYVSIRVRYDDDTPDAITAYLSGVLASAGFTVADEGGLGTWTADVSTDGWAGEVRVGEWSAGDDTGHDVIWTLSRS